MVLLIPVAIAAIALWWAITNAAQPFPTPNAARASDQASTPVRACSVPYCDNDVTINLRVGLETWPFCIGHGTPYLIGGAS